MAERVYALERLYEDQEPDLVADTIPAVLAWLGPTGEAGAPRVSVKVRMGATRAETLLLGWDGRALERRCRGTLARARRMRSRRTADREHLTELGAYGLALVGISIWMPGRRAVTFREGLPPDILLDDTDGALRGVEAAGRSSGGLGALRVVLEGTKDRPGGKRAQLVQRSDVAEAHVSLWCASPRVSLLLQVKP
jgi:hypothetical protein